MTDPIVFIPGILCDARIFLPQIVHLGAKYPVHIAVPATGETVEQMSERILATAPAKFALVGHGLGGAIALDILRRDMERVTRMALISTDPLAEAPSAAATREARIVAAKSGRLPEAIVHEYPAEAFAQSPWRAEIMALMQDMGLTLGEGVFMRQSRASQRRPDQQKTLRRAMLPTLVIAGESDTITPLRRQDFTSALLPYGKLVVIPEAGHLPTLEQPEAVTAALEDFLNGPLMLRGVKPKPA